VLATEGLADPRAALGALVDFAPDVASARAVAEGQLREATARLEALPPGPARQSLADIARFVLERDR
jgi:hypothetical protein